MTPWSPRAARPGGHRPIARLLCAFGLTIGMVAVSGPGAVAATCALTPVLRDVTVNQGVGSYPRLARTKDTLVRFYLSLPSCATSSSSIQVTGGSLTVTRGTSTLAGGIPPTPAVVSPYPPIASFTSAALLDSPGDLIFSVPRAALNPSGVTGSFTAKFAATIQFQSKTSSGATPVSGTVSFSNRPGTTTPISAVVEAPTKDVRILVVPMGDGTESYASSYTTATNQAVQQAMLTLSRIFPVRGAVGSLGGTGGGIKYTVNTGMLDLTAQGVISSGGQFCGTVSNFDAIKGRLSQFLQSWNTLNPAAQADVVLGVAPADSRGSSQGCAEGMAGVGSRTAWIRAVPDGAQPSQAGSLAAMEIAHTMGLVPSDRDDPFSPSHSPNVQADTTAPNRAYNVSLKSFLADDHTAMTLAGTWNNTNTVLEQSDWQAAQCVLGAANGACPAAGSFSVSAAAPSFVLSGTTGGTQATTDVVESYFGTVPRTRPDATSQYRLYQLNGGTVLRNDGVPVQLGDSDHNGTGPQAGPTDVGLFSVSFPFDTGATRIELWKGARNGSGSVLLYGRNRDDAPAVTSGSGGVGLPATRTANHSGLAAPTPQNVTVEPPAGSTAQSVDAQSDLGVTQETSPADPRVGNDLTFSVTVTNHGPDDATGVTLFESLSGSPFDIGALPSGCAFGEGPIVCSIGDLANGGSATLDFTLTPSETGTIYSNASVSGDGSDANYANDSDTSSADVGPREADLSVDVTDSPDPVALHDDLTYSIQVSNAGPDPATGVTVLDDLPPTVSIQSMDESCSQPEELGSIECNFGTIPADGSTTKQIVVSPNEIGTITNKARVSGNELDPNADSEGTNNQDSDDTEVVTAVLQSADGTATDNAPSRLRATFFTPCNGFNYVLGVGLHPDSVSGTQATFGLTFDPQPNCGGADIKLRATDGFTSDTGPTGETVDPSPEEGPVAAIYGPAPGDPLLQFDAIPLVGGGLDQEDGTLTGSALRWSFDGSPAGQGQNVDLSPPSGGWSVGDHTVELEVTDSDGSTDTASRTVTILQDADHDGIPAFRDVDPAGCSTTNGDDNILNFDDDPDGDGRSSSDEWALSSDPCVPQPENAAIIEFHPDTLNSDSSGRAVSVTIQVPHRSLTDIRPGSVRIVALGGSPTSIDATSFTVVDNVGTAKFPRQAVISFLKGNGIHRHTVVVDVFGESRPTVSPAWSFLGSDTFFFGF